MGLKELIDDLHIRESELRDAIRSLQQSISVNVNTVVTQKAPQYLHDDWTENGVQESVWKILGARQRDIIIVSITFTPNIQRQLAWCQISTDEDTLNVHTLQAIHTIVPSSTYYPFNMMPYNDYIFLPRGKSLYGRSSTAGAAAANHSYHYLVTYYEV